MKLGVLLPLVGFVLLHLGMPGCDRSGEIPEVVPPSDSPGPTIRCDQPTFDFGSIGFGEATVTHRFCLRNVGNAPLHIDRVRPGCGSCTVVETHQSVLKPDEETYVDVSLIMGSVGLAEEGGRIERSVYVESNDPAQPALKLTLRGTREKRHFYYPSVVLFEPLYVRTPKSAVLH